MRRPQDGVEQHVAHGGLAERIEVVPAGEDDAASTVGALVGPGHVGPLGDVLDHGFAVAELRMQHGLQQRRARTGALEGGIELVAVGEGLHAGGDGVRGRFEPRPLGSAIEHADAHRAQPTRETEIIALRHRRGLVHRDDASAALHGGVEGRAMRGIAQRMLLQAIEIQHHRIRLRERGGIGRPAVGIGLHAHAPGCFFFQHLPQLVDAGRIRMPTRTFAGRAADQHDRLRRSGGAGHQHAGEHQRDRPTTGARQPACAPAWHHAASTTQRKPMRPDRSLPGAINSSLPCWSSRLAWGKYQCDVRGS